MKQSNRNTRQCNHLYQKPLQLAMLFCLLSVAAFSQNYAWMKGSSTSGQIGTYGTMGVAALSNNPGSREFPFSWKDASGNFWLLGGLGYDAFGTYGMLNDLWRYNPVTSEWTWMRGSNTSDVAGVYGTQGVASALNNPGARAIGSAWIDAAGNFWLFGGFGVDVNSTAGNLNDLWMYNPLNNQWTWVKGANTVDNGGTYGTMGTAAAANNPGARGGSAAWADASGNLWIFGGTGFDAVSANGTLGDLWRYNIVSNQWTWMKGFSTVDQNGVYGTMGTAANTNNPGTRYFSACWRDAAGNFWMHGGSGFDISSMFEDSMNDLWKYNPTTNQWTWIRGSNTQAAPGVYGSQGTSSPLNEPGARNAGTSWADASGNLFMFGGTGYDVSNNVDFMNDLWQYNINNNQWTWLKGSNTVAANGTYGSLQVAAPANTPGGRGGAAGWTDASYNLWLFGGFSYDESSISPDDMNDVWKLGGCTISPVISVISNTASACLGGSVNLMANGGVTYNWSTGQSGASIVVSPSVTGISSYTADGADVNGCVGSQTVSINIFSLPNVTASTNKPIICNGQQAVISALGANSYTWNMTPVTMNSSVAVTPSATTLYTVIGTDGNGCSKTNTVMVVVSPCTSVSETDANEWMFTTYPNPNNGAFTLSAPGFEAGRSIVIYNLLGQKVFEQNLTAQETNITTGLPKGVYQYQVMQSDQKLASGKVMIE